MRTYINLTAPVTIDELRLWLGAVDAMAYSLHPTKNVSVTFHERICATLEVPEEAES